jgi:hypothetical protein
MYDNKSPEYQVRHWRNIPEERLNTLDDFLDWYKDQLDDPYADKKAQKKADKRVKEMGELITAFLEFDAAKIQKAEESMFKKWVEGALKS